MYAPNTMIRPFSSPHLHLFQLFHTSFQQKRRLRLWIEDLEFNLVKLGESERKPSYDQIMAWMEARGCLVQVGSMAGMAGMRFFMVIHSCEISVRHPDENRSKTKGFFARAWMYVILRGMFFCELK